MKATYKILIGVPSGGMISEATAQASHHVSLRHEVVRQPSCMSGANFNQLWCLALNAGIRGLIHRFIIMHGDIGVVEDNELVRFGDVLSEEMDEHDADFISVAMPIKDGRCLTATGIGDPNNPWNPHRRFTLSELASKPPTFDAKAVGYDDKFLIHSGALCMWDMTSPVWYACNEQGVAPCFFEFREQVVFEDGMYRRRQESEDWKISRDMWLAGAKTVATSRVKINHTGKIDFPNYGEWAEIEQHDDDTADNWRNDETKTEQLAAAS